MLPQIQSLSPTRRATPTPVLINLTLYGSPAVLASIRKRLYLELQQRAETVVGVRYSTEGDQASTAISLRSGDGNPWAAITWLSALCRDMGVPTLRVGVEPAASGAAASGARMAASSAHA